MTTNKYIVLRSRDTIVPTLENLGNRAGMLALDQAAESVDIKEVDLTLSERSGLRRDPRTHAISLPMPMKLIEPTEAYDVEVASLASSTWGLKAVRALESNFDGSGITIAVLDTGIDPNHPAFTNVDIVRRNFTTEGDDDQNGHGTHCAGTIFGKDVAGKRIGIARNIKRALIGKVIGEGGTTKALAEAILWAITEGAHVISMSLGFDFPGEVNRLVKHHRQIYGQTHGLDIINPATSMALEAYRANVNLFSRLAGLVQGPSLFGQGTVIVAASGNESKRSGKLSYEIAVAPPAAGTGIISVGALGESNKGLDVADFSNTQVDVSAPGINVVSAIPGGGLGSKSGTSMATPHVAGVAALWAQRQLEMNRRVENKTLVSQLIASGTIEALVAKIEEEDVGTGIVQAPLK